MERDAVFVMLASVRIDISTSMSACRLWLHPSSVYVQTRHVGILWDFMLGQYTLVAYQTRRGAFVVCMELFHHSQTDD